jgi:hypothetical protein
MTGRKLPLARTAFWTIVVVAGLLTVLCLGSLMSGAGADTTLDGLVARYAPEKKVKPASTQAKDEKPKSKPRRKKSQPNKRVTRIQKRNIFSPPVVKGFKAQLIGVLGHEAIFQGGQFVKVGGTIQGAKLLAIGPDWVEVEYEGKAKKVYLFGPGGGPAGGASSAGRPGGGSMGPFRGGPPRGMGSFRGGPGEGFRKRMIERMVERFKNMPAEERERHLKRMPAQWREQIEKEL